MIPSPTFRLSVLTLFFSIVLLPILFMLVLPLMPAAQKPLAILFESRQLVLARNSLILAAGTSLLALIIGVPFAMVCQRTSLPGRRLFTILGVIPILIPPYIQAIAWTRLVPGRLDPLLPDLHNIYGAIFVLALSYFPFVTILTISGLKAIDHHQEEVGLLHRGPWRTITGITLPLCAPHILCGVLFVFIFAVTDFGVPDIMRIKVYPIEIFIQFSAFYNERAAAILSYPLILITVGGVFLQQRYMRRRSYISMSAGRANRITYRLGRLQPLILGLCILVVAVAVALPIFSLIISSGSLPVYARVLASSWKQLVFSLGIAVAGGLATVALAFPLSHLIERSLPRSSGMLEWVSLVPFAIPAITLGIGLIKVWNRTGLEIVYNSILILVLGYVARFIPFAIRLIAAGLKTIDPGMEEAAELSTGSWPRVMRRIVLPLCSPSMLAGFFIVFVLSLGELGTSLLVMPPGWETLPLKIYNLMHYGAEQMVAALCLILVCIILLTAAGFVAAHKALQRWLNAQS